MKFSSEYQPNNRGRKPGSLNKANALIRQAAPDVIESVIRRAKEGDISAASLVLARTIPILKPVSQAVALDKSINSLGDLVKALLSSVIEGSDPNAVSQLMKSVHLATKVMEVVDLEARIKALEEGA